MKKGAIACLIAIVALVAAVIFAGCIEDRTGQESELQHIKTPIWDKEDLESYKYHPDDYVKITLHGNLTFYKGPIPLEFQGALAPPYASLGFPGMPKLLFYEFDGFQNHFIYQGVRTFVGARTIDDSGQVVAEARLGYLVTEKNELVTVAEEFHYGPDNKLIFKCTSRIDHLGIKTEEIEKIGKKMRDYYFIWPPPDPFWSSSLLNSSERTEG